MLRAEFRLPMHLIGKLTALMGMQCVLLGQAPTAPPPASPPSQIDQSAAVSRPPGAIYKDAMRPLDVVRGSLENWSDAELGALSVGMRRAREACGQLKVESFSGDDLYDLARLCSFGQDWNDANTAALAYVASGAETHRAQAYALSMSALVHINAIDLATQTAREMLRRLPYDSEVAYAIRYMKNTLEGTDNPAALTLAGEEHTAIVQALAPGVPLKAAYGDAVIGTGALYESAMELAFLERYAGDDRAAAGAEADVEGALPATAALMPEDRQRIDAITTQYRLLGARLPHIEVSRSLLSANAKAQINSDYGAATVLVFFPDWCVQCRRMMKTLTAFAVANRDVPIHAYGLMFADDYEGVAPPSHEENFKELMGTSTLVVSADAPRTVGAIDYPLGIMADKAGMVRYIGVIPGDAFNGDGFIEKLITRMVARPSSPVKTN